MLMPYVKFVDERTGNEFILGHDVRGHRGRCLNLEPNDA